MRRKEKHSKKEMENTWKEETNEEKSIRALICVFHVPNFKRNLISVYFGNETNHSITLVFLTNEGMNEIVSVLLGKNQSVNHDRKRIEKQVEEWKKEI